MEGLDKKMIRVLRELAARWKPGTTPALILSAAIFGFELYFEQHPEWDADAMETEETPNAEEQG